MNKEVELLQKMSVIDYIVKTQEKLLKIREGASDSQLWVIAKMLMLLEADKVMLYKEVSELGGDYVERKLE